MYFRTFFYPKQGQGFKLSVALTYTQILVEYPPISTHIWPLVWITNFKKYGHGDRLLQLAELFFNGKVKKTLSALKGGSISNVNLNHWVENQ